jgi:hypothetical protein
MTFFNKKEEVLEIELTSFGKTLHSKGKLKPVYYAFFDDDVIYDGAYGSSDEDVDTRITKNTPRSRIQYNYSSVGDTKLVRQEDDNLAILRSLLDTGTSLAGTEARAENELLQEERTKEILIQEQKRRNAFPPIGTSANNSLYHPAWKNYMLQGTLDSSVPYIDLGASTINIPQMNVKKREFTVKAMKGSDDNAELYGHVFNDGSSVTVLEDDDSNFLIMLKEGNASSDVENFSIEVFEVEDINDEEYLTPLDFAKSFSTNRIVDGMFVDDDTSLVPLDPSEDPSLVGYFFNLETDTEIDPAIISKAMQSGRFTSMEDLETFANSARFNSGDKDRMSLGNSASEIYGLSLSAISKLNEEALTKLQQRAEDDPAGLYDNGGATTDDCD